MEGKNKGKGKPSTSDGYRTVNAYGQEMFLGAFELAETNELASSSSVSVSPSKGMLECGATASAAPEAVVRGLISAVLAKDRSTTVRD